MKIYKNKILGLRGKAAGLIFPNFDRKKHVVSGEMVHETDKKRQHKNKKVQCWTGYVLFCKIPRHNCYDIPGDNYRPELLVLSEKVYSNADLSCPLAPSDTAVKFVEFLEKPKRVGICKGCICG